MRVGIDMLAVQSPGSRGRGVGRYAHHLVKSLLAAAPDDEFRLYVHPGLPDDHVPTAPNALQCRARPERRLGETLPGQWAERMVRDNPDRLDVFLTLNPFELVPGYQAAPRLPGGVPTAVVVYDFIPWLEPTRYLADARLAAVMNARLRQLASDDRLLLISEATRRDAKRFLGLSDERLSTIRGATDPRFLQPSPEHDELAIETLRLKGPFLFAVAGDDPRKNIDGLIRAFALLPRHHRGRLTLAIACKLGEPEQARIGRLAASLGVRRQTRLLGEISDEQLRALYRRCRAFVFPSLYEGLGLPLLEAMHSGAPVVAGRNSSQIEVVGDAGMLIEAADPADIARGLCVLLDDPALAAELAERGRRQASTWSWPDTASRALAALRELADQPTRTQTRPRERVAVPAADGRFHVERARARGVEEQGRCRPLSPAG